MYKIANDTVTYCFCFNNFNPYDCVRPGNLNIFKLNFSGIEIL